MSLESSYDSSLETSPSVPQLPDWLARQTLRPGESVTRVYGPAWCPPCERQLTHPRVVLYGLALGLLCFAAALWLSRGNPGDIPVGPTLLGGAAILGGLFLVGVASGYFTRLVVTEDRILILQGREVYRTWDVDDLPPFMTRYESGARGGDGCRPVLDLDALHDLMGGASDKVAAGKTILAFGRRLDQFKDLGRRDR